MSVLAHVAGVADALAMAAVLLGLRYLLLLVRFAPRWLTRWLGRFAAIAAILPALRFLFVAPDVSDTAGQAWTGVAILCFVAVLSLADSLLIGWLRARRAARRS